MSKVAVVRTTPETVLQDVQRVMQLAEVRDALVVDAITIIKNNLSWHLMYPGANTTPWQLEGTILGLRNAGFEELVCVENETVVTSAKAGEILNKQRPVCEHYGVSIKYNFKSSDMSLKQRCLCWIKSFRKAFTYRIISTPRISSTCRR
ncbi:hypothetical protein ES707_20353 [subsurface metagenome]